MGDLKSPVLAKPSQNARRSALEGGYRLSFADIPEDVRCSSCGLISNKNEMERHHPAGRRKDAFFFTIMLHSECHRKVHDHPELATLQNLLWKGRNSKILTISEAANLVQGMPFPPAYAVDILRKWKEQS